MPNCYLIWTNDSIFGHLKISGTPLSAAKRMQINLDLQPLEDIAYMQTVPEMVFPMLWVEEGANLNKTYVNMLKYQLFL